MVLKHSTGFDVGIEHRTALSSFTGSRFRVRPVGVPASATRERNRPTPARRRGSDFGVGGHWTPSGDGGPSATAVEYSQEGECRALAVVPTVDHAFRVGSNLRHCVRTVPR